MRASPLTARAGFVVADRHSALSQLLTAHAGVTYPPVQPGVELQFPRDEGSHPDYRLEWWYVTGWLEDAGSKVKQPIGFQVTFFRVRTGLAEANPSSFAPRQVLFAHAALADPEHGKLRHAQRSAREGFDLAYAREGSMQVKLDDWSLRQVAKGRYVTVVRGEDFEFELTLDATQPPLLQGERGYSRKGPDPRAASYYYSLPQLAVTGTVTTEGRERTVYGQGMVRPRMVERLRRRTCARLGLDRREPARRWRADGVPHARSARWRALGGSNCATLTRTACDLSRRWRAEASDTGARSRRHSRRAKWNGLPLESWRSSRTGVQYPVRWRVRVGTEVYRVEPLLLDAELDSRATTGILYWEGPIRLLDDTHGRGDRSRLPRAHRVRWQARSVTSPHPRVARPLPLKWER